MVIQIDTKEKARAIKKIISFFDEKQIAHISSKLYVGDYMNFDNPRLIIDRKQNLSEVYSNLCPNRKNNPRDENGLLRIDREVKRANQFGIKIIFLVEHGGGIKKLDDVKAWQNPQLKKSPYAWSGETLYKHMFMFSKKYDVEFVFCDKRNTGKTIAELLAVSK